MTKQANNENLKQKEQEWVFILFLYIVKGEMVKYRVVEVDQLPKAPANSFP
jgi:hypothetical protein